MAEIVIHEAAKYLGVQQGGAKHKNLINKYNAKRPIPVGYPVKYTDDWCAAFVTVIGDLTGASHYFGRECSVQRYIYLFQLRDIWKGRVKPRVGDLITFDWDGNGWSDHIGFVEKVSGDTVTTIEGNTSRKVARRTYKWNDKRISGFARPKYPVVTLKPQPKKSVDDIAREVIKGSWGNGEVRRKRLTAAGYDAQVVQEAVNRLSKKSGSSLKSNEVVAREVVAGKWENGKVREQRLTKAGYNYGEVQKIVNRII